MTQAVTGSLTQAETHPVTPLLSHRSSPEIFYPSEDGEPLAETSLHADAIIETVTILRSYLSTVFRDRSPIVLADQFLYYAKGFPRLRVAPDIMVIFGIPQVPYDNYKIWETGQVPRVIFEMTSKGTQTQDQEQKKTLYENLGVQEYWLFDPKGEWIPGKLRGYQLNQEKDPVYEEIIDGVSSELGLTFKVEGSVIGFYCQGTGEKLIPAQELLLALEDEKKVSSQAREQAEQERQRAEQERQRAEQERQRAEKAEEEIQRLREQLGLKPVEDIR